MTVIGLSIGSAFFFAFRNNDLVDKKANAADPSYSIDFDCKENRISSTGSNQNYIGHTHLGNQVSFYYSGVTLASDNNNWASFSSGGQIGNNEPISGIKSFCVKFAESNEGEIYLECG